MNECLKTGWLQSIKCILSKANETISISNDFYRRKLHQISIYEISNQVTAWHLWSALVNQASLHFLKPFIHFFFMSIVVLSVYLLLSFECLIKVTAAVNTRTIMFHLITLLFTKRTHYPKWITVTRTWSSLVVPMLLNTKLYVVGMLILRKVQNISSTAETCTLMCKSMTRAQTGSVVFTHVSTHTNSWCVLVTIHQ